MKRKLWIILALAALILALGAGSALADQSGSCGDNVTYTFDPATGALTISGTGAMANYQLMREQPWADYRLSIHSVVIQNGVTIIGNSAFESCSNLDSVVIPDSVVTIGHFSFRTCSALTSVTIPSNVTTIGARAFENSGLTSVVLSNLVATINAYAFNNCQNLTSAIINNSSATIGERAFDNCPNLTIHGWTPSTAETYANNNNIPFVSLGSLSGSCGDNVTYSFDPATGALTISGTGEMWDYDTEFNTSPWSGYSVTSVTVQNGVTRIGAGAFYGCAGLTSITIPGSVAEIGDQAFGYCTALTSVTIPEGVTTICRYAFEGCAGLTRMTMPSTVTTIQYRAFRLCSGLTDVTINNFNAVIGDSSHDVFEGCPSSLTLHGWPGSTAETYANAAGIPFVSLGSLTGSCGDNVTYTFDPATGALTISGTGAMTDYVSSAYVPWNSYRGRIKSASINSGVTNIGFSAFFNCTNLTGISIPDSVTSIDSVAFQSCANLTHVTIPNSVTRIGRSAFYRCTGLTSVTIPNSVIQIGYYAFKDSGLISAFIMNPDCTIGDSDNDVFQGCDGAFTLFGYSGSTAEAYARDNNHSFDLLAPAPDFFLPAALTSIEADAFQGISAQAVVIPKNIQSISGNPFAGSGVLYIYGFPGTAAEALAESDPIRFMFFPLTDAWYARLTN